MRQGVLAQEWGKMHNIDPILCIFPHSWENSACYMGSLGCDIRHPYGSRGDNNVCFLLADCWQALNYNRTFCWGGGRNGNMPSNASTVIVRWCVHQRWATHDVSCATLIMLRHSSAVEYNRDGIIFKKSTQSENFAYPHAAALSGICLKRMIVAEFWSIFRERMIVLNITIDLRGS